MQFTNNKKAMFEIRQMRRCAIRFNSKTFREHFIRCHDAGQQLGRMTASEVASIIVL